MACFLVPAAEAVIVTAVEKAVEKKEAAVSGSVDIADNGKNTIPFSRKLSWLKDMLVGGVILLLFEHIWHGEVVPWFPFLSAMSDPSDAAEMFHEMATAGVCMAVLVTVVWLIMCKAADVIISRKAAERSEA
ncbi:MAG: hypothetical protein K5668_09035 [Lachnospiraceae bacterium]|nr:hypothetical protein [Lachnospiraceae bacterium]